MIILFLSISSVGYLNFTLNSSNSTSQNYTNNLYSSNSVKGYKISTDTSFQNHKVGESLTSDQSNLSVNSHIGGVSLTLNPDSKSNISQYKFNINSTDAYSKNSIQNNTIGFTANPLYQQYDKITGSVSPYLQNNITYFQTGKDGATTLSASSYSAQGVMVKELSTNQTGNQVDITGFNITFGATQGDQWIGSVWNATTSGSKLIPDTQFASYTIASSSFSSGSQGNLEFKFSTSAVFNTSNTLANSTGGYLFFVFATDSAGDQFNDPTLNFVADTTDGNDGTAYRNTDIAFSGTPIAFDWALNYTKNVAYNASTINTKLQVGAETPISVDISSTFQDINLRSTATSYTIYANSLLDTGISLYFNVSYTLYEHLQNLTDSVKETSTAGSNSINWEVKFNDQYYGTNPNATKYFEIPKGFTNFTVTQAGSPATYTTYPNTDGVNQTLEITSSEPLGQYVITAQSLNLFKSLVVNDEVNDGTGFISSYTAYMGNSTSAPGGETAGDTIRASVTVGSVTALGIATGSLNSTLRAQDGTLITSGLTYGVHSVNAVWNGSITFTAHLDPNLDTGVWSVQFKWTNGTHGGVIYTEFAIIPKTDLQYLSPSADFNALEASTVRLDVGLFDYSHAGRWVSGGTNTNGVLQWNFGTPALTYQNLDSGSGLNNYSTSLDLTYATNNVVANTAYTLNATFTDGFYTIFTIISMTVYYRGSGSISIASSFEYGSGNVVFDFTPFDTTSGGNYDSGGTASLSLEFTNSTKTITLVQNTDYTVAYSTPTYTFTVPWTNTTFELGSSNSFTLTWSVPDLRETANSANIVNNFGFTGVDTASPQFVKSQSDITVTEANSIGTKISWNVVDDFSSTYSITNTTASNNTAFVSGLSWTSGTNITYTFAKELWTGTQTYRLDVTDTTGNSNSATMTLTVTDATTPIITAAHADFQVSIANDISSLNWTFTDKHPSGYTLEVTRDSGTTTSNATGSWLSGQVIQYPIAASLPDGSYNFTMWASDVSGNTVKSTVIVNFDRTTPGISKAPNVSTYQYDLGGTGNVISWVLSDANPNNYTVLLNGTVYNTLQGTFTNNQAINANVDGFDVGIYNLTIVVFDSFGNKIMDQTTITVNDASNPVINTPSGFTFESGTNITQDITWTPTDDHAGTYKLYENDVVIQSGSWSSGVDFIYDVTSKAVGVYNYTLVVFDASLNKASSTVIVNVVDTTLPQVSTPTDTRIFDNQTDYSITWDVSDLNPNSYTILQNGTEVDSGSWISGQITYGVGSLTTGIYNFTIAIYDTSSNEMTDTVIITVKPSDITETALLTNVVIKSTVLEGDVETFNGNWTELLSGISIPGATITAVLSAVAVNGVPSGTAVITKTFTTDTNGKYSLILNYTGLNVGNYQWTLVFEKQQFETQTIHRNVEVTAHNVKFNIDHGGNLVQGEEFTVYVTVTYDDAQGQLHLLDLTSRSGGVYNATVTLIVEYNDLNGDQTSQTFFGVTDKNGVATIRIPGTATEGMQKITGINASIQGVSYIDSNESADQTVPQVDAGAKDLSYWVAIIQGYVEQYWQYILIALVVLLAIFFMLNRRAKKNKAKKAQLTQEIETATEEVSALISIQAIILKNSESGIPFYNATFEAEDDSIDLSLISSLTTAISTFLSELHSTAKGFETMEREGIQLVSHRGELSDFIIISKKSLPVFMYQQIQNAHGKIEEKFSSLITNPAMIYEIDEDQINTIMREADLKLDLKGLIDVDPKVIDKVKNNSTISRNVRNNLAYIQEYADMVRDANLPITLASIIDFLETKEINFETASRLILVAYANGVLLDRGS